VISNNTRSQPLTTGSPVTSGPGNIVTIKLGDRPRETGSIVSGSLKAPLLYIVVENQGNLAIYCGGHNHLRWYRWLVPHITFTLQTLMKNIQHVPRSVLTRAERSSTSVQDLISRLPKTVCEDYCFEVTLSGGNVHIRALLKNKPVTIVSSRYPKLILKYSQ